MSTATPPDDVLSRWHDLAGRPARPFGTGLINSTFRVEGRSGPVVVQRLHPVFAGTVNEDIDAVTRHLERRGLVTPRVVATDEGALWTVDREGRPWRALTWVEGTSIDKVDAPERAREAGALVARFHAAVADLDWDYRHVRAGVHDTPRHLTRLAAALEAHRNHRLFDEVAPVAREVLAAGADLPDFSVLPRRHAHGDLKISNLLFDASGHALCLVDLDTLGRMPWPHELGDALRSWCNPAGEDTPDNTVDTAVFTAAVEGYASVGAGLVTPREVELLVPGFSAICLELSARFLVDALEESYFGWNAAKYASRGAHNLVRAKGQWSLCASVRARAPALEQIVRSAFEQA